MSNPPVKFKKEKEIITDYETQVKGKKHNVCICMAG